MERPQLYGAVLQVSLKLGVVLLQLRIVLLRMLIQLRHCADLQIRKHVYCPSVCP